MPEINILHVEDDADEAFFVRRALEKADARYRIHHIVDGEQAIAHLGTPATPPPHVILLDLKLPAKDGFEVLAWVRAQPTLAQLPVVVLTSSDRPEDMRRATDLGVTAYLNKSISCRNVLDLLPSILKN